MSNTNPRRIHMKITTLGVFLIMFLLVATFMPIIIPLTLIIVGLTVAAYFIEGLIS